MSQSLIGSLRREAREAPSSGIVEVFNYGRGRPGLIPLWVGEGDLATPDFICEAAGKSLAAGETFYTWQRGIPELRAALADYHTAQFGRHFEPDRFYVTGSGMQAIQIAIASIAGTGDEIVVPSPAWPNFAAALGLAGATPRFVPMQFGADGWTLDVDAVEAAIGERTRAISINSPSNPTGWTASEDDLRRLLAIARAHGIWIVADEVYSRFFYEGERAPSFYDVMEDDDRILFVNTFSKNWAMTGWRVGWISAPPALGEMIENLVQYSTSGVAAFMQRGAVAALRDGEDFVRMQIKRAHESRDALCAALAQSNRVAFSPPAGAFYLFFAIDGEADTRKLGLRLIDEANIGLAPGTAFGPGGEGFVRLCFARKPENVVEAARRLTHWLGS